MKRTRARSRSLVVGVAALFGLVDVGVAGVLGVAGVVVGGAASCDGGAGAGEGEGDAAEGEGEGDAGEGEGEGEGDVDTLGFTLRTPEDVTLPCEPGSPLCDADATAQVPEIDHVCTFDVGRDAVIYVQATPTAVNGLGVPTYDDVSGALHDNGSGNNFAVEAAYDAGGNHRNDFIDVTVDLHRYRFNHSSYGFGFRVCQPPDCLQTLDDAGNVVDDGCGPGRTHPVVCARVEDGTLPSLEDTFAKCPGDPN